MAKTVGPNARLISALSLCKKAGALVAGFDAAVGAAQSGSAKLLLLAADASPGTRKRALARAGACPARDMPVPQEELLSITHKPVAVFAVINEDLAVLCQKALDAAREENQI